MQPKKSILPGMSTSNKKVEGASKSNDDGVCEVIGQLQNMSTVDDISICANCAKEGSDINNTCNKCKMVKYCNAACKKKHRHKHKKECERYIAEQHDEELFKQPPPKEDCPICFLRIPTLKTGRRYYACCGKVICSGCVHAPVYDDQGNVVDNQKCPFCRTPWPKSDEEGIERLNQLVKKDDPLAIHNIGHFYNRDGTYGYPQDYNKALELWHRAAELGYAKAYYNIGLAYHYGRGVEVEEKKSTYYYEMGAMRGCVTARHNLGTIEEKTGNMDRALKHYMISVRNGNSKSLKEIKRLYSSGHATKEDYTKALHSYQEYLGEIKSPQRDKAAAANEYYRYC